MELVHMDNLTTECSKGDKEVNIFIIIEYFTRYAQAMVTNS